ncbi:MAG: DUF364 domain-containing protein [Desulfobacteraceae bacterium]|jgi:hypothetical protein
MAMELDERLYRLFQKPAAGAKVETLCLGLGYTAVATSDGGTGIAYTYLDAKTSCGVVQNYRDFEGQSALELLGYLHSADPLERTMALALVNALNHRTALGLPDDPKNGALFDALGIGSGTRVAMVGLFGPLMRIFKDRGAVVETIDLHRRLGRPAEFLPKLSAWAEVLILTATSILNATTEEVLAAVDDGVKTVLLGPSTPLAAEAFAHLPVHFLAGTVPLDREAVLKAVRHGAGTRVIQKYGRKVFMPVRAS